MRDFTILLRDIDLEIEQIKARKEELKKRLLEHRSQTTEEEFRQIKEEKESLDRQIKEKEERRAQIVAEAEKEENENRGENSNMIMNNEGVLTAGSATISLLAGNLSPNNFCFIADNDGFTLYYVTTEPYETVQFTVISEIWSYIRVNCFSFTMTGYGSTAPDGAVYSAKAIWRRKKIFCSQLQKILKVPQKKLLQVCRKW